MHRMNSITMSPDIVRCPYVGQPSDAGACSWGSVATKLDPGSLQCIYRVMQRAHWESYIIGHRSNSRD